LTTNIEKIISAKKNQHSGEISIGMKGSWVVTNAWTNLA